MYHLYNTREKSFYQKNIKRFKNIGNCTFLLGIFNILNNQHPKHFLIIIDLGFFRIDNSIFLYIELSTIGISLWSSAVLLVSKFSSSQF